MAAERSQPPMIRGLRAQGTAAEEHAAECDELIAELASVTVEALREPALTGDGGESIGSDDVDTAALEQVRRESAALGKAAQQRLSGEEDRFGAQVRRLRMVALEAQRATLLHARSSGAYSSQTIKQIQLLLDAAELRDGRLGRRRGRSSHRAPRRATSSIRQVSS